MRTPQLPRDEVERRACDLVRSAARTLDGASPRVGALPLELLSEALARDRSGGLRARLLLHTRHHLVRAAQDDSSCVVGELTTLPIFNQSFSQMAAATFRRATRTGS